MITKYIGKITMVIMPLLWNILPAMAEQVNVVVAEVPPYTEEKAQEQGLVTAIVTAAFAKNDIKVELTFADWLEAEQYIDDQRVLSFMWVKSKPLMRKWFFSNVIYQHRHQLAHRLDKSLTVEHLYQLMDVNLGINDNFSYGELFENFRPSLRVIPVQSDHHNLQNLFNKRVDMVVISPFMAHYLIDQYFQPTYRHQVKFIEVPFFPVVDYRLVCAKLYGNCMNYIKKFNRGLVLLRKDGTREQILSQFKKIQ